MTKYKLLEARIVVEIITGVDIGRQLTGCLAGAGASFVIDGVNIKAKRAAAKGIQKES